MRGVCVCVCVVSWCVSMLGSRCLCVKAEFGGHFWGPGLRWLRPHLPSPPRMREGLLCAPRPPAPSPLLASPLLSRPVSQRLLLAHVHSCAPDQGLGGESHPGPASGHTCRLFHLPHSPAGPWWRLSAYLATYLPHQFLRLLFRYHLVGLIPRVLSQGTDALWTNFAH